MNKKNNTKFLLVAGLVLAIFVAIPVFAETAGTTTPKTPAVSITTIISNADKEIDQRVQALNDLLTRIGLMKRVSSAEQSSLNSLVQAEVNELTALKAKIDADTSISTAKTDYQSITKSYRIYALVLPQTRIIAAADRVMTIVDSMDAIGKKVQTRISTLTGTNSSAINQIFSDFTAKIVDASAQATASANEVLGLLPDQGDNAKMQGNTTALKDARSKIKTATSDLVAARKDIGTIVKDLKEIGDASAH